MQVQLSHNTKNCTGALEITGSKSESNRLLVLQAQYPNLSISNLSNSDDTKALQQALTTAPATVDIHHAGTAMRFLTAYYASTPGRECLLTGSSRMQERPIGILVEALRSMGANIEYAKKEGFPPLQIIGTALEASTVRLPASISSQFITALLLTAPKLKHGLKIILEGAITSRPYIEMTCALMRQLGIDVAFTGNTLEVAPTSHIPTAEIAVESDWSSASYAYSILALAEEGALTLTTYRKESLQGDACLQSIYTQLGVESSFEHNQLQLRKIPNFKCPEKLALDLAHAPDIAQTIAVSCAALGVACSLTGLHTLKIKETDRLVALQCELEKFGAEVHITADSLHLQPPTTLTADVAVATYNDHRMALAFAPLALKTTLQINDALVVNKSYPSYWEDLKKLGFSVNSIK
ncbi:MAG: 3-phosphoshikimate 1-carboxyvinyltransferase [Flavobacteriales bacterium]